jgi:hypothetical protein
MLHKPKDCTLPSLSLTSMVACDFSQFFIEKIDKIREKFSDAPASPVSSIQPVPADIKGRFVSYFPLNNTHTHISRF